MKVHFPILFVVIAFLAGGHARADKGFVPFEIGVEVFEPKQRAIISFNGQEETLLLSTDLKASGKTKVLEILPLPSKPHVSKGDERVFTAVTDFINQELEARKKRWKDQERRRNEEASKGPVPIPGNGDELVLPPAGRVEFQARIGAHDISVAQVMRPEGFVEWASSYVKAHGSSALSIPDKTKQIIAQYLSDGFTWFVFDVVELNKEINSNEPIQYKFAAKSLYYPLRITRTGTGYSRIDLIVISPHLFQEFPGLSVDQLASLYEPITATRAQLSSLSPDLALPFTQYNELFLRTWRLEGIVADFTADLIAAGTKPYKDRWKEEYVPYPNNWASGEPNGDEQWHPILARLARKGLVDKASQLVDAGADLNEPDPPDVESGEVAAWPVGKLVLIACARKGHLELAKKLLDLGVAADGRGPMYTAAEGGHLKMVELFFHRGVSTDAHSLELALGAAITEGHDGIVRMLLMRGANVEGKGANFSETFLNRAVERNRVEAARLLLDHGADVNGTTRYRGQTPLMYASRFGFLEMAELLLSRGADVTAKDRESRSALEHNRTDCKDPERKCSEVRDLLLRHMPGK